VNPHLWWYVARAGGLVAWALGCLAVFWGLALSTRLIRKKGVPAWLLATHRHLGALTLVFTGVHVGGLVADDYVHFGAADVLLPFASSWRPGAVAWGIVSMQLLVAIEVTSLLMRHLRRRLWRAVHVTSFGVFAMGTVHAFTAGTDGGNAIMQWTALAASTVFVFLVAFRQLSAGAARARPAPAPARAPGAGAGRREPVVAVTPPG
jgi:hypothetical protein